MKYQDRSLEDQIRELKFLCQAQTNSISDLLWGHVETGARLCPEHCRQITEFQEILNDRVTAFVDKFENSIIDELGLRFVDVGEFKSTHELAAYGEHAIIAEDKSCQNTQKMLDQFLAEPSGKNVLMHFSR